MKITKITEFEPILGTTGKIINNGQLLQVSASEHVLDKVRKFLTITNTSVMYRIRQLEKNFTRGYNSQEMRDEYNELKKQQVVHYYHDGDGCLICPAGLWWLCEDIEGHKGDIPYCDLSTIDGRSPRPYQVDAVKELLRYKRSMVSLATGSGKTIITCQLVNCLLGAGKRVAISVPSIELVKQTYNELKKYFGDRVCAIGGIYKWKPGYEVYVSTIHSIGNVIDTVDAAVIDECVPYDTYVHTDQGKIPIGQLYKLQERQMLAHKVLSFNLQSNKFEYRNVVEVFKNRDRDEILEVKLSGRIKHKCTPEHKWLTSTGWKPASELQSGDLVYTFNSDNTTRGKPGGTVVARLQEQMIIGSFLGDGHISHHGGRIRITWTHGIEQQEYCKWKVNFLGGCFGILEKNGYSQKPAISARTKLFGYRSDFPTRKGDVPDWLIDEIDWPAIAIWFMDDGNVSLNFCGATLHTESFSEKSILKLVDKLNTMGIKCHKHFITYTGRRVPGYNVIKISVDGLRHLLPKIQHYLHPDLSYKTNIQSDLSGWVSEDPPEYTLSVVKHIKKVSYTQYGSAGHGLFDMEVEGNHNYVIASRTTDCGMVVHNCHHSSSSQYVEAMSVASKAKYVYGLTATPIRADGLVIGIHSHCGPVVYEKTTRWCIDNGYLVPAKVRMVYTTGLGIISEDKVIAAKAYKRICAHAKALEVVARLVKASISKGMKTLIVYKTEQEGQVLSRHLKGSGIDVEVAHAKYRKPLLDYKSNVISTLISNINFLGEGVDVPNIDCVIDVTQVASEAPARQLIGRGLRLSPGKKELLFFSVVLCGYGNYRGSGAEQKWNDLYVNYSRLRLSVYKELTDDITELTV